MPRLPPVMIATCPSSLFMNCSYCFLNATEPIESFLASRKLSGDLESSNTGIDSRKGAKHAKFGKEFCFLNPLRLSAFAGDIPIFGCGVAALGPLRSIPIPNGTSRLSRTVSAS
jgi:hypothetical protein